MKKLAIMNIHDFTKGDLVLAEFDGDKKRGEVTDINVGHKQLRIHDGIREYWYGVEDIFPLELNDEELQNLKFHKLINEDGTVKYAKGAFRMLIPSEGDFSRMEIWYRDEARHITAPISLHELQNHFLSMTKVHLNDEPFD